MDKRSVAAERLAHFHYSNEPDIRDIYRCVSDREGENDPVKLLEVNAATIPSGIMPIRFDPAPASGVPYSSVIVEVTPAEFEQIRSAQLPLPSGWKLDAAIQRPPAGQPGAAGTSAVTGRGDS